MMTCHFVNADINLGRSTVIDLKAPTRNKLRHIDLRTIEFIIAHNTKYVLNQESKMVDIYEEEKRSEKWNKRQLAVGNWFSSTNYYMISCIHGDHIYL